MSLKKIKCIVSCIGLETSLLMVTSAWWFFLGLTRDISEITLSLDWLEDKARSIGEVFLLTFISLCTTPRAWHPLTASTTCRKKCRATSSVSAPLAVITSKRSRHGSGRSITRTNASARSKRSINRIAPETEATAWRRETSSGTRRFKTLDGWGKY